MLSSCANAQDTRYTLSISQLPNYCCFAYRVAVLNKSLLSGYTLSISQGPRSFSWSCQAASLDQRARGHWAEIRMRTSYDLKWPNYSSWVSPYRKNTSRSKSPSGRRRPRACFQPYPCSADYDLQKART